MLHIYMSVSDIVYITDLITNSSYITVIILQMSYYSSYVTDIILQ